MLMFTANQQVQRILYIDSSEYDTSSVYVDVWRCGAGFNVNIYSHGLGLGSGFGLVVTRWLRST